jgi:integrase
MAESHTSQQKEGDNATGPLISAWQMPPQDLISTSSLLEDQSATSSSTGRKRGPVPRRRFQKGCFVKERNGSMYSMLYIDAVGADGAATTKQVKQFLGNLSQLSERAARREHARIMEQVNLKRGSIAPAPKGQTFADAVSRWRQAVAPNISPASVRPRESFLRVHIMPRFAQVALHEIGVHEVQQFATDLRKTVSGKTVVNILSALFAVLKYAERCGMRTANVGFKDLQLGSTARETHAPFFTRAQANDIIAAAPEPYKTLFSIAWMTGCRAGELLALTIDDLNFTDNKIRVNKSSDDNTREIRQPKTKCSVAMLPMPSALEAVLRNYIRNWTPNRKGILFATRNGLCPRSRDNVVKCGLKPVLRKLGIPTENTGLHAFRHGLATELAEAAVPLTVLQNQLRHADVKTTLKIYAHVIPQSQRDAMENLGAVQSLRSTVTLLKFAAK